MQHISNPNMEDYTNRLAEIRFIRLILNNFNPSNLSTLISFIDAFAEWSGADGNHLKSVAHLIIQFDPRTSIHKREHAYLLKQCTDLSVKQICAITNVGVGTLYSAAESYESGLQFIYCRFTPVQTAEIAKFIKAIDHVAHYY